MENKKFDDILNLKLNIGKLSFKLVDLIFVICIWTFAFLLRIKLFPIVSGDFHGCLSVWMDDIRFYGPVDSFKHDISNYTPPYLYLMCLVSGIENDLYALKSISVFFDYVGSIAIFMIIYELTKSVRKSIIGMTLLLISPAVVLNSAYWCQCDMIYSSFVLFAFYAFLKKNSSACMILLGVALSFKLQTVFILPFFLIMWLKNKNIRILDAIYIPFTYIIMMIPAIAMGKPLRKALLVYFEQTNTYPYGTMEYPNLYVFLDEGIEKYHHLYDVSDAGLYLAIILLAILAFYLYSKSFELTNEIVILIALFSVSIACYTLPHMHDRYGMLIDLLAIIYLVLKPSKIPMYVSLCVVTILTYMKFLIGTHVAEFWMVAVAMLAIIVYMGRELFFLVERGKE